MLSSLRSTVLSSRGAAAVQRRSVWGEVKARIALGEVADAHCLSRPKTVTVIGAPMTYGQPLAGTDQGPRMIRDAGLRQSLISLRWRVEELGDLQFSAPSPRDPQADPALAGGEVHNCYAVGSANKKVFEKVFESASAGKFPLVLGGDHSLAVGSLAGVLKARPDAGIVWVDAHADINSPETSPSGNMHGMPLSLLIDGLAKVQHLPGFEWLKDVPKLAVDNLVYVGLRDIDDRERLTLRRLRAKAFTMQHVDKYGIGKVMEMALDHLLNKDHRRPLHLSYDVDAIDPVIAPSTGTIVRGGLTYREAHYVAESVAETGCLGSMDMVEVNPSLLPGSGASETADLALGMIVSAMGSRIL